MQTIHVFDTEMEASLAKDLLMQEGIEVRLFGNDAYAVNGRIGMQPGIRVMVPEDQASKAKALVDLMIENEHAWQEKRGGPDADESQNEGSNRGRKAILFPVAFLELLLIPAAYQQFWVNTELSLMLILLAVVVALYTYGAIVNHRGNVFKRAASALLGCGCIAVFVWSARDGLDFSDTSTIEMAGSLLAVGSCIVCISVRIFPAELAEKEAVGKILTSSRKSCRSFIRIERIYYLLINWA
jgi:hypothetical protein